jgi:hypothetical protein
MEEGWRGRKWSENVAAAGDFVDVRLLLNRARGSVQVRQ